MSLQLGGKPTRAHPIRSIIALKIERVTRITDQFPEIKL